MAQGRRAMNNLALLVACFALGVVLRRSGRLPDGGPGALNAFIINIALPALILTHLHAVEITSALVLAAAVAWVLFALSIAFFGIVGRVAGLAPQSVGALTLTGGLANTSFLGIPMIEAFYGSAGVAQGLVIDQLGSYLALATLGIVVATMYSGAAFDQRAIVRKIVTFPPLLAVIAALLLRPLEYPEWLATTLLRLGDTLAPLALVSVGAQVRLGELEGNVRKLALGLGFKLVFGPAALVSLFVAIASVDTDHTRIIFFEAAMAPMIGAAIVATEYRLDPPLTTLMVGIGIPLSFLTVPAWWYVLGML
jgi:malate permease and related proteins